MPWSLIQTAPNSSFRAAFSALPMSRVQTEAAARSYIVRPGERLVIVGEALNRNHRSEDLSLHDLVLLVDVGDDRWPNEEAAVAVRVAAREHGRAGALQEPEHPLLLGLGDDRPHLDLVPLGRVADLQRLDGRDSSSKSLS